MADEEQQPLTGEAARGVERVRSIEQPLAAVADPAPTNFTSKRALVPSSLDTDKICRYCLEDNDEAKDPFHPDHLIAPCQCRGGSMWVHRGCLDEWRATRSDRAFYTCTECHFSYEFVEPDAEQTRAEDGCQRQTLRVQFQLLVARDFVKVFLGMQLAILCLGGFIRCVDCEPDGDIGWWGCANVTEAELLNLTATYHYEQEDMEAGLSACCPAGTIVNRAWPFTLLKDHSRSAYYLVGVLAFCALYGCVLTVVMDDWRWSDDCCCRTCQGCARESQRLLATVCCYIFWSAGCGTTLVLGFVMLVVVFTYAGAMAAAMAMSVVVQRGIQRHMHVRHRREMAPRFVVEDLCGREECRSVAEVLAERGGVGPPTTAARTSVGNRVVIGQQEVQQRLRDAGVVVPETPTSQSRASLGYTPICLRASRHARLQRAANIGVAIALAICFAIVYIPYYAISHSEQPDGRGTSP